MLLRWITIFIMRAFLFAVFGRVTTQRQRERAVQRLTVLLTVLRVSPPKHSPAGARAAAAARCAAVGQI